MWINKKNSFLLISLIFFKKGVAPPTQDATQPAEKSRNSGKVSFFCTLLQAINKKRVSPASQDATLSTDEIRVGEKVCFFCTLLQDINKIFSKNPMEV